TVIFRADALVLVNGQAVGACPISIRVGDPQVEGCRWYMKLDPRVSLPGGVKKVGGLSIPGNHWRGHVCAGVDPELDVIRTGRSPILPIQRERIGSGLVDSEPLHSTRVGDEESASEHVCEVDGSRWIVQLCRRHHPRFARAAEGSPQ